MSSESIRVTVAVPTYNRDRLIAGAVGAILQNSYEDFELIVVDQSESRATKTRIEAAFGGHPKLRYIHTERVGISHARNVALHEASGNFMLYTDDDVIVPGRWIESYVRSQRCLEFEGFGPAVIGGPIRARYESPRPSWWPEEFSYCLGDVDLGSQRGPYPDGMLPMGANIWFPVDLLKFLGGFDERFGYGGAMGSLATVGEESLAVEKIARLGYGVFYEPEAWVTHLTPSDRLSLRYFGQRLFSQGYSMQLWEFALDPPTPRLRALTACKEMLKSLRAVLRIVVGMPLSGRRWSMKEVALQGGLGLQFLGRMCGAIAWPAEQSSPERTTPAYRRNA